MICPHVLSKHLLIKNKIKMLLEKLPLPVYYCWQYIAPSHYEVPIVQDAKFLAFIQLKPAKLNVKSLLVFFEEFTLWEDLVNFSPKPWLTQGPIVCTPRI